MTNLASYFRPEFSDDYSPTDALAFAVACALSYEYGLPQDGDTPNEQLAEWGFSKFKFFSKTLGGSIDTQGFVAEYNDKIIIAFRGSESARDWITNAKLVTDPGPLLDSQVHEGFQDALFPVVIKIVSVIYQFDPNREKDIWITGHSLGGALAVLLTAMLIIDEIKVKGLYTFGAPRVGNTKFAEEFDKNFQGISFRVVNEGDLVPHLPSDPPFYHTKNRILFKHSGERVNDKDTWEDFKKAAKPRVDDFLSNVTNLLGTWISHIGKDGLAVKEYHVLGSQDGYLNKLKKDLGVI